MRVKVFTLDNHYIDCSYQINPENAKVEFPERIALYKNGEFTAPIGQAKMVREGNDFFLENIEIYTEDMRKAYLYTTPAIAGEIIKSHYEGRFRVLSDIRIDRIDLALYNSDKRIKSIEQQIGPKLRPNVLKDDLVE